MFFKTCILKIFAIVTGKHQCWRVFLKKLQNWRLAFSLKRYPNTCLFLWILQDFWKQLFYGTPVDHTSPKFYGLMDIRYLKVIFCCCKIRAPSGKKFTIDRSKFLVKRCFFLNQDFNSPWKIFLLYNHL